ncbi:MAG: ThuA domain-containing protein [Acidobacteriota bacterium]
MGLFEVEVATTPPEGGDMSAFQPDFSSFDLVVSNYNGEPWSDETNAAFEKFVSEGGGFVSVHAADNAFPDWHAYNQMIGIGGWRGRTEKNGPYLRLSDSGDWTHDMTAGPGGHHGQRIPFAVDTRLEHPITAEMPERWMHATDELYDSLRGPAENVTVLASAYSDPETGGTGRHEPILMTIPYGKGRVFHTTLGHSVESMLCIGFITTFQRGAEWAATGEVTQYMPADFPTAAEISAREPE